MNISNQNNYRPNFKAIKVATTQNIIGKKATNIDLYRIQKEDRDFLLNLKNKIDYKKFFPNLQEIRVNVNGQTKRMTVCTSCLKAGKVQKAV